MQAHLLNASDPGWGFTALGVGFWALGDLGTGVSGYRGLRVLGKAS